MRFTIFGGIIAGTAAITTLTYQPGPARACNPNGYVGSICWTAIPYCPEGYLPADGSWLFDHRKPTNDNIRKLELLIGHAYGTKIGTYETRKYKDVPKDWERIEHEWNIKWYKDKYGNEHNELELIISTIHEYEIYSIPDLRGHEPVGTGTGWGLTPISAGPINSNSGKGFTLRTTTLPEHDHGVKFESPVDIAVSENQATERVPTGNVFAKLENPDYEIYTYPANGHMASDFIIANIIGEETTTYSSGSDEATSSKRYLPSSEPVHIVPPQLGMLACINVGGNFPPIPATEDKKPTPQGGTTP
ncbi:hypothetical protein [uncultured Thalassospira sp.]|uniref:hypothetical protein n=1 Tax=uncultured Thalassospira sp. TaxID=404382 RepID=UPI0030D8131A